MKAVIYARYSCDHQREESIEGQLRECKEYAEKNNITVIGSYIDRAMSAKTDNRPQFQQMIKDSAKQIFDAIIVWKLDRFARNRYDSAHYKAQLRKNGVKVVSATEVISEGAEGIILESVLEGFAEYYSAELSEKVIRGMTENALKCQYNGGLVPIGYRIDENKHYQIDELTAPFVAQAFQMYCGGKQIKEIVEFLNAHNVKSSYNKNVTKTTVSALLQNRKYIGEYKYRDVVIPGGVPAIISEELFNMAQDRLERNRRAPSSYKSNDRYILTTKLFCAECGSPMVGESARGRHEKQYFYYKCSNAKKHNGCKRKALRKQDIEDKVINRIVDVMFDADTIDMIADRVLAWQKQADTTLPILERELAEVEKSLGNVMTAIEQGIITPTTKNRMAELENQKKKIEIKIAKEQINTQILTKDQIIFWLTNITRLDLAQDSNRQRIVDTFVNSIYVHEDRVVININCHDDEEIVPFEVESGSFLSMLGELSRFNPSTLGVRIFL